MIRLQKVKAVAAAAVVLLLGGMLGVAVLAQARAQVHGSNPHATGAQPATAPADKDGDPADAHARAAALMKVTQVIPILQVNDIQTSLDYYNEKLGFETLWTHGDPDFAAIGRDGMTIFLQRGDANPCVIYMVVSDVNGMHTDIAARGAEVVQPPEDRPWGMREMIVKDPDENHIRGGTMRDHAEDPVKPKGK